MRAMQRGCGKGSRWALILSSCKTAPAITACLKSPAPKATNTSFTFMAAKDRRGANARPDVMAKDAGTSMKSGPRLVCTTHSGTTAKKIRRCARLVTPTSNSAVRNAFAVDLWSTSRGQYECKTNVSLRKRRRKNDRHSEFTRLGSRPFPQP